MVIVLSVLLVILGLVALFYRSKAKEFESLFELSKNYDSPSPEALQGALNDMYNMRVDFLSGAYKLPPAQTKLNKDGSIAKKRGPKPKGAKNVKTV